MTNRKPHCSNGDVASAKRVLSPGVTPVSFLDPNSWIVPASLKLYFRAEKRKRIQIAWLNRMDVAAARHLQGKGDSMTFSNNLAVRILVVDRDARSAEQIRRLLWQEGFGCQVASDAAQALTSARENLPCLMIVDTQLDACSGFDLVRAIKDENPRHEIPVIFISETGTSEMIAHCRQAGGTYFLGKPFDPSVLLELVDKALWMPHLVRRHIDAVAHESGPRAPLGMTEVSHHRRQMT